MKPRRNPRPGGAVYTAWEYAALWNRYRWTPADVDAMPSWIVRRCLDLAP